MTTCSLAALGVGEELAGTAPVARAWIVLEHPGPWGRDALLEADLPDDVRALLLQAKGLGIGVLLARHPDRTAADVAAGRHLWVARSAAGGMRLRHAVLPDWSGLARCDADGLAAGALPAIGQAQEAPLLLVCTHGKRDQCCSVNGRALLGALHAAASPAQRERIWESSHIGGHRFSPVTLSLPSGTVHGRRGPEQALDVLARHESGHVLPAAMRGRSCFPAPLQAADVAVRTAEGIEGCDDIDVLAMSHDRAVPVDLGWAVPTGGVDVEVRHVDGRAWRVHVEHTVTPGPRPESCGAEPGPVHAWAARTVTPASPWR